MTQLLITLLMLDAGIVCVGLALGWNMWAWIIAYWAILTAKNALDWRKGRGTNGKIHRR